MNLLCALDLSIKPPENGFFRSDGITIFSFVYIDCWVCSVREEPAAPVRPVAEAPEVTRSNQMAFSLAFTI